MATLILPYPAFTAGTPAVAAEVQDNFTTIRDHINGQNIGTANLENTLVSRVGGPILFLNQASQEQIALSILNSRTKSALQITQSAVLGAGSSIIHIDDNATQTTGDANLFLDLQPLSTIPAILVKHGAVETMSLTKTQLDLFAGVVQATSAGVISATTANLTTANATTVAATNVNTINVTATGLLNLTAPSSDAIVAKVKGRSSDNNAIVQFKSNDDATVYASATSSSSGLTFNLPDTADSYTFQVNGVTKAVIDNNGIDAQYLTSTQQPFYFSWDASVNSGTIGIGSTVTLKSTTFTITKSGTYMVNIGAGPNISGITSSGVVVNDYYLTVSSCANMQLRFVIQKSGVTYHDGFWTATQRTLFGVPAYQTRIANFNPIFHPIILPEAGTYNLSVVVSNTDQDYFIILTNIGFKIWSL